MVSSFSLGLVAHNLPAIRVPLFILMTFSMVLIGRYLRLPPPGGMFIIMASVLAIFMPVEWSGILPKIGIVAAGAIYAWIVSLFYNLWIVRSPAEHVDLGYGYQLGMVTESLIVSAFVVLSLEVALWLDMPYPYWVPVSCYVIMQGMQLRTMWIKQLHRILGTGLGYGYWGICGLVFIVTALIRHRGSNRHIYDVCLDRNHHYPPLCVGSGYGHAVDNIYC